MTKEMPHTPPIRVAILECDTSVKIVKERYGGYGGCHKELLNSGASALARERKEQESVALDVTVFDIENLNVYPSLEEVDAVLITGSKHDAFSNSPWILDLLSFTQKILAQDRVRVIGVCFGFQIIGRALGARVDRNDQGWEISVCPINLTEKGKQVFGVDELSLHQMHRDIVYDVPTGVERLGHSPKCGNQAMYARNRLLGLQAHPEFSDPIMREILNTRHDDGVFDDDVFEDGMRRVGDFHGGVIVGKAFVKFLLEG